MAIENSESELARPEHAANLDTVQHISASDSLASEAATHAVAPTIARTAGHSGGAVTSPTATTKTTVGDYQILNEIAHGGMGVVYKARHRTLGRIVALKQIRAGEFAKADDLLRFQAEAQAAAQLDHQGIVPVFDVGDEAGHPYMAMAFVDGPSLWQQIKERPLEQREAARIMQQVAEAVEYAHLRGIVHRDLKPQNILMAADGHPKVTDFGLAKQQANDSNLTQTGQILGTPSFMPPEQADGRTDQVGPLADVYSLGATLYCLITGRPPFQSSSPIETLKQVLEQEPVSPRALNPSLNKDLETICLKCLQKAPSRRYVSAGDFAADLQRFLNGEAIAARPTAPLERAWRWCRRKPLAAGLLATTAMMLVLLLTGLWYRGALIATAQRLESAERLERVSQYHKTISQVREASGTAAHGWTWEAERQLREARPSLPSDQELVPWETAYADVLMHHDLRHLRAVAEGIDAGASAYSPDGTQIAVSMSKHALEFSVSIYSVADGELLNTYTASNVGVSLQKLLKFDSKYQDGIWALAWSPDGRWLVGGSRFGNLVRWDTQQPKDKGVVWKGHEQGFRRVGFTTDSKTLVTASETWNLWTTAPDWSQQHASQDRATDFAISPDGRQIAVVLENLDRVDVLDLKTRVTTATCAGSSRPAFSPNGRFLVTTLNEDGRWIALRLSDTGAIVRRWRTEKDTETLELQQLAFLTDSLLLGVDVRGRIFFWNTTTGQEALPMLNAVVDRPRISFHPATQSLAVASTTALRATDLFDLRLPAVVTSLPQPGLVRGFGGSPDGNAWSVVSDTEFGSSDQKQRSIQRLDWDLATRKPVQTQQVTYPRAWTSRAANVLARHPISDHVAWSTEWLGLMVSPLSATFERDRFVPYPSLRPPVEIDVSQFVDCPATRGGRLTVSPSNGSWVTLDGGTVSAPSQLALPFSKVPLVNGSGGMAVAVQYSVSERSVAEFERGWIDVNNSDDSRMDRERAFSSESGTQNWCCLAVLTQTGVKAHPNGLVAVRQVAGPLPAPTLTVQRSAAFPFARFRTGTEQPMPPAFGPVAWSPDGRRLWGLTETEEQLAAWDAATLALIATWNGSSDKLLIGSANIYGLAVGNRHVVCVTDAGVIRVFSAADTGPLKPVNSLHLEKGMDFRAAALDRDESWVILSTLTGVVEIRNVPQLELLASIPGHKLPVRALALGDRDRLLATGCDDGWIRLFRIDGPQQITPWIKFNVQAGPVDRLRLSADGRVLAAATRNATSITVWDLAALEKALGAAATAEVSQNVSAQTP